MASRQLFISSFLKRKQSDSEYERERKALSLPDETNEYVAAANLNIIEKLGSSASNSGKKRGSYVKVPDDLKVKIGKYALQNGNMNAVRYFSTPTMKLNEPTVRHFKKIFAAESAKVGPENVAVLPHGLRGRPLLLGKELDEKVQLFIRSIREAGGVVNRSIVCCAAEGIVMHHDESLLGKNGGHININNRWAQSLLTRMNMVKKKGTKAARHLPTNFEDLKQEFFDGLKAQIEEHSIPRDMIVNIDQTGVKMVPTSEWTLAEKGSKQVSVTGLDDKREITALLGITLSGKLLPTHLIYAGKTAKCHPNTNFPHDFHITHSESHWSTDRPCCSMWNTFLHHIFTVLGMPLIWQEIIQLCWFWMYLRVTGHKASCKNLMIMPSKFDSSQLGAQGSYSH